MSYRVIVCILIVTANTITALDETECLSSTEQTILGDSTELKTERLLMEYCVASTAGKIRYKLILSSNDPRWIGVGWSEDPYMPDTDSVIALPASHNSIKKYNLASRNTPSPLSDARQDLEDVIMTEVVDGKITLMFTRKLVPTNADDGLEVR